MAKKNLILLVVIVGIATLIYAWLGGFSRLSFSLENAPPREVYGEEFIGRPTQPELETIFYTYRDLAATLNQPLVVITYPMPDTTAYIRQFIGVAVSQQGLEVRKIEGGQFVKVILDQNLIVTPSPEKVQGQASEYAKNKGLELNGMSIEFYSLEQDPVVWFPVE